VSLQKRSETCLSLSLSLSTHSFLHVVSSICYGFLFLALKGRDPVRTKIVIDNKIIEQVNSFNYLGNMISYEKEFDIDNKLHNYLKITGIINNVCRPQK
jgi:hypothetical protein